WSLHLKLGFDRNDGFVVYTQDDRGGNKALPELMVGASLDVPDTAAQLAFIHVDSTDVDPTTPEFRGAFSIDLRHNSYVDDVPDCPVRPNAKIRLSDLAGGQLSSLVNPRLNAEANIDWKLHATPGSSALPGVGAEFTLHWKWQSDASPSDPAGLDRL